MREGDCYGYCTKTRAKEVTEVVAQLAELAESDYFQEIWQGIFEVDPDEFWSSWGRWQCRSCRMNGRRFERAIVALLVLGYPVIFSLGYRSGEAHTLKYMCRGLSEMLATAEPLPEPAAAIARSLQRNCLTPDAAP
ncbi:MAG: hypothetical protein ACFB9N_13220 [Geitlerinemataceae cyanobacterium]